MRPLIIAVVASTTMLIAACGTADNTPASSPTTTTTSVVPATATASPTTSPTTSTSTTTSTTRPTTIRPLTPTTTTAPSITAAPTRSPGGLAGKVVVVDPGHNGRNGANPSIINALVDAGGFKKACNTTGTAGPNGYSEALFNWQTSQLLVAELRAAGATVVMTRSSNDGVGPCVDVRGQTAATSNADVLVSIHADGSATSNHGFHVIYPPVVPGYIETSAPASERIAQAVRDAQVTAGLSTSTYIGTGGLSKRSDLGTLNRTGDRPAIIIECGNMKNAADLAFLQSSAGQTTIARALVTALTNFFAS